MAKYLTMSKWKYEEGGKICRSINGVNGLVTMGKIVSEKDNGPDKHPTLKIEYTFEPKV